MAADTISLRDAAEQLGLHYMTVYRYVRTGRLAASKQGGQWFVALADLEALAKGVEPERNGEVRARFAAQLEDRLLAADEPGSWAVVSDALTSGAEPAEVHLRFLIPAMRSIGERWARGEIEVFDEHQATVIATRIAARLGPRFHRRGQPRGHVVIGLASGDNHALTTAIIADLLRGRQFHVTDLGADTPTESFLEVIDQPSQAPLAGLVVSCTTNQNFEHAAETVRSVRAHRPNLPIALGGTGVPSRAAAEATGADLWADDVEGLLTTFDELVPRL